MSTVLDEAVLEERPEVDLSLLAASLRAERGAPVVLSLDIGTSGVRASLFDSRGNEIEGSAIALRNELSELSAGADVNAEALVDFVVQTLDVAIARAESFVSRIDYVAASCFWHSLVGVDEDGRAIMPLLGWADTRAADAVRGLQSTLDERKTHARTGARFHPSYWPAKLLWLRGKRRELFDKTRHWLSFSDYLFLQLFGETATSVSMASATGIFDQTTCGWDAELLAAIGVSGDQLPTIARPAKTLQSLREDYAMRWPLLDRAAWLPAVGDGAANNIGAGCITDERLTLMIGTSGAMRALFAGSPPEMLPPELFCYRADRGRVVVGGALSDGGGLHAWMTDALALDRDPDELDAAVLGMKPDAHGLTILPFWSGERATGWSASARGAIVGLTVTTKPIEILQATMEAICYRFALLARALEQIVPDAKIVASGNALLGSRAWSQMIADALGRRIELSPAREASCRGAALLALETIGKIDALETFDPEPGEVIEPDLTCHAIYGKAIERQQELYEKLIK